MNPVPRHFWHGAVFFLTLGALAAITAIAADPASMALDWKTHAPVFNPNATPSATPMLLYFQADWCGFCKQMDRTTLQDSTVRMRLATLVHIKLDFNAEEELVKRFGITGIPAFVLVNERGEEVSRFVGATDPQSFYHWLDEGEKQAATMAEAAQKLHSEIQRLSSEASSTDPAVQANVRARAFDWLGRGDPAAHDFASGYIAKLLEANPASLIDGLAHTDLSVRIAVANLLRSKLGSRFTFDPWASVADRQSAIDQLRQKMKHWNAGREDEDPVPR